MKICKKCGNKYPETNEFFSKNKKGKNGFYSYCKSCGSEYHKKQNKTISGIISGRNSHWKRQGIKNEDFSQFKYENYRACLIKQNNQCAVCKTDRPIKDNWVADHDHKTGIIRGVLCLKCNSLLGMSSDNIEILYLAIQYLNEHSGQTSVISVK